MGNFLAVTSYFASGAETALSSCWVLPVKEGNKATLQRVLDVQNLPAEDQEHIFYTLDNLIKAAKFKSL